MAKTEFTRLWDWSTPEDAIEVYDDEYVENLVDADGNYDTDGEFFGRIRVNIVQQAIGQPDLTLFVYQDEMMK